MLELILILGASIAGLAVWKEHMRERKFEESLDKVKTFLKENPDFLADDEEDWYEYCENSVCAFCDDVLFENDAFVGFPDDEDGYLLSCEYCLNPDLKD